MQEIRNGIELVEIIDLLCKSKKISRNDFCKDCNIPPSTIASWKSKNIFPTVDILALVAHNLGISFEKFVYKTDEIEILLKNNEKKKTQLVNRLDTILESIENLKKEVLTLKAGTDAILSL